MSLFSSSKSYLGIDLGSASLKLVELKSDRGRARLVTYGFYERPLGEEVTESLKEQPEHTAKLLKEVMSKAGVTTKKAVAALPTFNVFSSILSLPKLPTKELDKAIRIEAKKVVPLAIDDMILDWKIIETDESREKKNSQASTNQEANGPDVSEDMIREFGTRGIILKKGTPFLRILLTAASKKHVQRYLDIFQKAGLTLLSLETEAFALTRSLVGRDKSAVMIADIGATNTDITVIDHGIPVLNRSINIGGVQISKAIGGALGLNLIEAEQTKKDVGLGFIQPGASFPSYLNEVIIPIVKELRYAMAEFVTQCQKGQSAIVRAPEDCQVEKIIISGGSAVMPGLPEYLADQLKRNVYVGDPWARVIYPNELQPVLAEIGSKFNVAVGLAMREILLSH